MALNPVPPPDISPAEIDKSQLYGSAVLYQGGTTEIDTAFGPEGVFGVVLGYNADDPTNGLGWAPGEGEGHALTFGATRSGKGVAAIIPALITYAGSAVVIDPKGENAWTTAPRRRQLGHRVVILDHWGEVNRRYAEGGEGETVTRFNPLSTLDPKSPDFADEVAAIADALIIDTTSDPHWSNSARELIGGLIAAFVEARPGSATLRDVRRALLKSPGDFDQTVEFFERVNPDGLGTLKLAGFKGDNREVNSIRSTARTQTAFLEATKLQEGMETDDPPFDLAELATGRVTLYLVLPVDRLQTHGRWLRLILTLAIRAIARQPMPPNPPVLFLLDEMGTVGRLSMVEQAFGLMAGLGIRLWGFLQDLNQLKRDYSQSWETFIANSAFLQVLNARDQTTCEYFSIYFGDSTVTFTKFAGLGGEKSTQETYSKTVMRPEDIRRISNVKSLVCFTQSNPHVVNKLSYYSDSRISQYIRKLPQYKQMVSQQIQPLGPALTNLVEVMADIKKHGYRYNHNKHAPGCFDPAGKNFSFKSEALFIAWWNQITGRRTS